MKKYFILLLITMVYSFGQWKNLLSYEKKHLVDIKFVNSNVGFSVGYSGTILKTIDAGENWKKINSGTVTNLKKVIFLDSLNGIILGDKKQILKTKDAGENWEIININNEDLFNDVFFINNQKGYIVTNNTQVGKILKTDDGGLNWQEEIISGVISVRSIWFLDEKNGFIIVGTSTFNSANNMYDYNAKLLKTENAGLTWSESIVSRYLSKIEFFDDKFGIVKDGNYLNITYDAGLNWQRKIIYGDTFNCSDVYFKDTNNGIAIGSIKYNQTTYPGSIFITNDGGTNWERTYYDFPNVMSVEMIDTKNIIVTCTEGEIFKSFDGGHNWSKVRDFPGILKMHFKNKKDGVGFNSKNLSHKIKSPFFMETNDSGKTWQKKKIENSLLLKLISFFDRKNGYAFDKENKLLKTDDGGDTWQVKNVTLSIKFEILSIKFIDENIGYILARNEGLDCLLKSSDGGNNWTTCYSSYASGDPSMFFIDENIGYICTARYNGVILKTINGGKSFNEIFQNPSIVYKIYFIDKKNGILIGDQIYRTEDAGNKWEKLETKGLYWHDINFLDSKTGYAINPFRKIIKTTDGGKKWSEEVDDLSGNNFWGSKIDINDVNQIFVYNNDTFLQLVAKSYYLSPTLNNFTSIFPLNLSWQESPGVTEYNLQISKNELFNGIIYNVSDISNTEHIVKTYLDSETKYYWRVSAQNGENRSMWSDVGSFYTGVNAKPKEPKLIFPKHLTKIDSANQEITWEDNYDAQLYQIQVSSDSTFKDLFYERDSLDINSHQITNLEANKKYFWRIKSMNDKEHSEWSEIWCFTTGEMTGIKEEETVNVNLFNLSQNYPNPFNPTTTITFKLEKHTNVVLEIIDLNGSLVKKLVDEFKNAGEHKILWDATNENGNKVSSGIYIYRIKTDNNIQAKKMILIK